MGWSQRGTFLALGTSSGETQIWDISKAQWCALPALLLWPLLSTCPLQRRLCRVKEVSAQLPHTLFRCLCLCMVPTVSGQPLLRATLDGQIFQTPSRCLCLRSVRTMSGHRQRVGAIAWGANCLSTGSRDRSILQRDIRAPAPYHDKLSGHRSEVPGLKPVVLSYQLAKQSVHGQCPCRAGHGCVCWNLLLAVSDAASR